MTKTAKEMAEMLDGRQYGSEMTKVEEEIAKVSGLIVVFGYSDDCVEFRGEIYDEWGPGEIPLHETWDYFNKRYIIDGILKNRCHDKDCPYFQEKVDNEALILNAKFTTHGWKFELPDYINVKKFSIYDGNDLYCEGIVFPSKAMFLRTI